MTEAEKDDNGGAVITSRNNPLIRETAKLADKKYRAASQSFFFEGKKLFEEALKAEIGIQCVFVTEKFYENHKFEFIKDNALNFRKIIVTDSVYGKISEEKSPEGVFCVAKYIDIFHKNVKIYNIGKNNTAAANGKIFIVSEVRDAGNLGTIIRCALAFGVDELILSSDCADIYSPKTIRASMGALFKQKITVCGSLTQAASELKLHGHSVYAASLSEKSRNIKDIITAAKENERDKIVFAVGNEGHGLGESFISACSGSVIIPVSNGVESLNVSAAAAILMWETYGRHE